MSLPPKPTVETVGEAPWGRFEVTVCAGCNQVIGPDGRCSCDERRDQPPDPVG